MTREKVFFFFYNKNTSGHDRCHRALAAHPPFARRPHLSLSSQRGRLKLSTSTQGPCCKVIRQFFFSAEPASSFLETSVRFHFHFHHHVVNGVERVLSRFCFDGVELVLSWVLVSMARSGVDGRGCTHTAERGARTEGTSGGTAIGSWQEPRRRWP